MPGDRHAEPSEEVVDRAAAAFAAFLSSRGTAGRSLISETIVIERFGFDDNRGEVLEELRGIDAAKEWTERSPAGTHFEAKRAAESVRYEVSVVGFRGGGVWRLSVDEAGRITHVEHRPDDLKVELQDDPEWRDNVQRTLDLLADTRH